MIECRGVSASVGNFAIHDISFVVPRGVHAALAGPTASGKTTLLGVIAGAVAPTSGDVRLCGSSVTALPPESRGIGFVPQHGFLFPHLSAAENIRYGEREAGVASSLVKRFGIDNLMHRSVRSLSGGECQLVGLCRALAPKPAVLLMDEPFSALDTNRLSMVLTEFSAVADEWNLTVLHVTHHAGEMNAAALKLEMCDGRMLTQRG